tara:strand:- start:318 stop:839 length:522 start_codon:yes stop_codon:yes gene_type:complete
MVKFSIKEEYETKVDNIFLELANQKFLNYLKKYDESIIDCYIEKEKKEDNIYKTLTVSVMKTELPKFLSLIVGNLENKFLTLGKYDLEKKEAKYKVKGKSLDLISSRIIFSEKYESTKKGCVKVIDFIIECDLPVIKNKVEDILKDNFIKNSELRHQIFKKWIKKNKKKLNSL